MTRAPAGWYPDPYAPGQPVLRYWDGSTWTAHAQWSGRSQLPPATTPDGQVLAGWWWRVAAYLLDSTILQLVLYPLAFLMTFPVMRRLFEEASTIGTNGADGFTRDFFTLEIELIATFSLVSFSVMIVYYVLFLRWKSATPGKLIVGLRVRLRDAPGPLPWRVILLREAVQLGNLALGVIPFVGLFVGLWMYVDDLWPLWDSKKQALHDKAAGTNVVMHDKWFQPPALPPAPPA